VKARVRRTRALDDAEAAVLAREASQRAGAQVDAAFVRAVADPPAGRIGAVVLARLAERHHAPIEAIKRALFPHGRR
jgi:hypothetical protein